MSEYKLVPVEPNSAQITAGRKYFDNTYNWSFVGIYKEMLSASPEIVSGQGCVIQSIQTDTVTINRAEYEAMKVDIKRMRIAIAVYWREELDCNTAKDDNDAINQFCEMYRD